VRRADVARLAGTSPAVVSYVLNGGPRPVAAATRARVLAAVEQLGYRPNGIARSLRMRRTQTLGLVVPDTANPFFAELGRAVEECAFAHGYTLLVGNSAESEARQTSYVHTFLQQQVDGLFLVPAHGPLSCAGEIERARVPWVVLDRQTRGSSGCAEVRVDHQAGARHATEHLLEHGHRRIGCIAGPVDVASALDRVAGWRDALTGSGLLADAALLRQVPFGRTAGYEAARDLLATTDVTAVFVASDEQAAGVLRAAADAGIRCPDDVAIVSFDGSAASAFTTPSLSTMAQPFAELAALAMDLVRRGIHGEPVEPGAAILPVALRVGGSCGCVGPADQTVGAAS
jgi:LacI family transcriptional regulator